MCFSVIVFLNSCCSEVGQHVQPAHDLEKRGHSGSRLNMAMRVLIHEMSVYSVATPVFQLTQMHAHTQSAKSF